MKQVQSFEVGERVTLVMEGGEAVIKGSPVSTRANLIGRATISMEEGCTISGKGGIVLTLPSRVHLTLEGEPNNVVLRDLRHVSLERVEGNLVASRIGQLEVSGGLEGEVALSEIDQPLTLESVMGNLVVRGGQSLEIGHVEGSASLVRVGAVMIGAVEGQLAVVESESVQVERVEGNAALRALSGAITIGTVEGNLAVSAPGPTLEVNEVEGNAALEGFLHPGGHYRLGSNGEIRLNVEGHARIVVRGAEEVLAGADMRLEGSDEDDEKVYWLGEGENPAQVELELEDGKLFLNHDQRRVHVVWGEDVHVGAHGRWSDESHVEMHEALREAREEILRSKETMKRELKQALREGGSVRDAVRGPLAELLSALRPGPTPPPPPRPHAPPPPPPPAPPARDELKLILNMLQEGQISAEEAEKLIAALSGSSAR